MSDMRTLSAVAELLVLDVFYLEVSRPRLGLWPSVQWHNGKSSLFSFIVKAKD